MSYEQRIIKAGEYLSSILNIELRKEFNIGPKGAPLKRELFENHSDFITALENRNIKYNDILNYLGLELNLDMEKWSFLDFDLNGYQRSRDEMIKTALDFYNRKIYIPFIQKKYDLGDGEAPIIEILTNENAYDFIAAIHNRNILYNDILEEGGYVPHLPYKFLEIGRMFHWIAEKIFVEYTRLRDCMSFFEIFPSKQTTNPIFKKKFSRNHCDNALIIDKNSRNLSENINRLPGNIEIINIDYFLGTSEKVIIDKCLKGYQGVKKLLILVPINASKIIQTPENIPFRNNVLVLNPKNFTKFFGFNSSACTEFIDSTDIAKKATYNEELKADLLEKGRKSKEILLNQLKYTQNELEQFLKRKNKDYLL